MVFILQADRTDREVVEDRAFVDDQKEQGHITEYVRSIVGLEIVGPRGSPSLHDPHKSVGTFLAAWLTDSVARKVRPRTLAGYEQTVRLHLTQRIGRVQLRRLTPQHLERLMNRDLAEGRSPRSVGQISQSFSLH